MTRGPKIVVDYRGTDPSRDPGQIAAAFAAAKTHKLDMRIQPDEIVRLIEAVDPDGVKDKPKLMFPGLQT